MMVLPPAGFLVLGLLLALKRAPERRSAVTEKTTLTGGNAAGCH